MGETPVDQLLRLAPGSHLSGRFFRRPPGHAEDSASGHGDRDREKRNLPTPTPQKAAVPP